MMSCGRRLNAQPAASGQCAPGDENRFERFDRGSSHDLTQDAVILVKAVITL